MLGGEIMVEQEETMQWLPGNGVEFNCFVEHYCFKCTKDLDTCNILDVALVGDSPSEWLRNTSEMPYCTAFEERNND